MKITIEIGGKIEGDNKIEYKGGKYYVNGKEAKLKTNN